LAVRNGDVIVLVGTVKGAFLARRRGRSWDVGGPFFAGQSVYAMAYDARAGRHRVWAATEHPHFGSVLRSTDDFGRRWTDPETANVRFPTDTGESLKQIWQIALGRPEEPDILYCGTAPAALFVSKDAGKTFALARGLWEHPHRPKWQPGGGGLCLHTIVPHPKEPGRLLVAVSTAGVYLTSDGGRSWRASNRGIRAQFLPNPHPEFGQCVHKVVRHPKNPERFFLQNHWGLYRSDDGGASWKDIANHVPSDFGFAMAIHPKQPDTVYIVPLESDQFRCPPGARLRVYRTKNAGKSWQALSRGLPKTPFYEAVLRDALSTDGNDPAGVYFGTRGGKLFASKDAGTSWKMIADSLPAITCVKAAVVDLGRPARR
jgi:photosystem II stability/assembly factor-like uncharacterized protein